MAPVAAQETGGRAVRAGGGLLLRGVGAAPAAVEHMLAGRNAGKVVLRVAHDA